MGWSDAARAAAAAARRSRKGGLKKAGAPVDRDYRTVLARQLRSMRRGQATGNTPQEVGRLSAQSTLARNALKRGSAHMVRGRAVPKYGTGKPGGQSAELSYAINNDRRRGGY